MKKPDWTTAPHDAEFYSWEEFRKHDNGKEFFWDKDEGWVTEGDFDDLDWHQEQEDFEMRPKSPTPAWNGEGLPPVGTVCEVGNGEFWRECEIIAHFQQRSAMVAACTIMNEDGNKTLHAFVADAFRPFNSDRVAPLFHYPLGAVYDAGLAKLP